MEGPSSVSESIPENFDFGFCPINEVTTKQVTLVNPNRRQPVQFHITANCPFAILPTQGTIPANGKAVVNVSYKPLEAIVLVATIIFHIDGEKDKVMKLSAIGKYSYITLNKNLFNFGELLIGNNEAKDLLIKNQSPVPTTVHIEEDEQFSVTTGTAFSDEAFRFDTRTAIVPANASFLVKITFTPSIVGMFSSKNFLIRTEGGNKQKFSCIGYAVGMSVRLSSRLCNFGQVEVGRTTSMIISIFNDSTLPCNFKFFTDQKNIFSFKKTEGSIGSRSNSRVIVYFRPQETYAYYQRVFCLVQNHSVLYLDLIGSCYDILNRPLPLSQQDIILYRSAVFMGNLQDLLDSNPVGSVSEDHYKASIEVPVDEPNQVALHKEMFQELKEKTIACSEESLDFGFCATGKVSDSRSVLLTNRHDFDVFVVWLIPSETMPAAERPPAFNVRPLTSTIRPGEIVAFQVQFAPYELASYFYHEMQCQIYVKRNSGKVLDELGRLSTTNSNTMGADVKVRLGMLAIPPDGFTLPMVGHSFPSNFQTFIPMVTYQPRHKIQFPPCSPGDSYFQSLQLVNSADTPCYYSFLPDPAKVFKVYPSVGFIPGKTFTLVAVQFAPRADKIYNYSLKCMLNHGSSIGLSISLIGVSCIPKIYLDNEAKIYYPPLYTGVASKQKIGVLNSSRIPIEYAIEIPEKYSDELTIEPLFGSMHPNEKVFLDFTFTAIHETEYRIVVPINVSKVIDPTQDANHIGFHKPGSGRHMDKVKQDPLVTVSQVVVYGSGGKGKIDMNPKAIDFKTVSIGFSRVEDFILSNISHTAIFVKLRIVPKDPAKLNDPLVNKIIRTSFSFDFQEGVLAANSNQKVHIRFVPDCRSQDQYYVQCLARQSFPNAPIVETLLSEETRIEITAHGDFPVITISDLRNNVLSPATLWKQFHLTDTIAAILSPLNDLEIKFNNAEIGQSQAHDKLKWFLWDFGKVVLTPRMEERKVILSLKNIGGVSASFKFVFPNDNEVKKDTWAKTGEPTEQEAFEKHILDKKIFNITPRGGNEKRLECDELVDVELVYNSTEVGVHELNVLFQIIHGKPVMIKLRGETLPFKRAYMALGTEDFECAPLPIGMRYPVVYPIEIRNLGGIKSSYEVGTRPLQELQRDNFDFAVFQISEEPSEKLEPGQVSHIRLHFHPLEAKTYEATVPVLVKDSTGVAQTLQLRIRGKGYHLQKPTSLPSIYPLDLPNQRASFSPKTSFVGFSIESVDFGEVVYGHKAYRMVMLYNRNTTSACRFTFQETTLLGDDVLVEDPASGEVQPNSYVPIKLILTAHRLPTIYEGELECVVEWDAQSKNNKSVSKAKLVLDSRDTLTSKESIFLRIRKQSKVEVPATTDPGIESSEPELLKNVFKETVQAILCEEDFDQAVRSFEEEPNPLFAQLDNSDPPFVRQLFPTDHVEEEEPREYSASGLFLEYGFLDILDITLENTVFNILCEAIYGEADLLASERPGHRVKRAISSLSRA